jgi:hypothetical protein
VSQSTACHSGIENGTLRTTHRPRKPAACRRKDNSAFGRNRSLEFGAAQYDAQTAPSFGPYVARTLTNATVVTIPNFAHVAFGSPSAAANACAYKIVRSFFEVLNRADTSCITLVPATNFAVAEPSGKGRANLNSPRKRVINLGPPSFQCAIQLNARSKCGAVTFCERRLDGVRATHTQAAQVSSTPAVPS